MPRPERNHPTIPDHEVLRKIGGGSYGEVWIARGVTGALRAVKVVWREDFEDERTFEREFEGLLKFEPISRDHPGLVNILHVGRSPDGKSFYYYVMELGDDVHSGQDINPVEYEARTLRADGAAGVRHDTNLCIDVGVRLAEALDHLHELDLAHRDVKPSNVIFVNGKAKLADIGLVAARGQRTFVGTEGFVPPEGPGSAQADVYSLGKVLYEIATGKDRLDFPELPDELPTGLERKRWLELNRIICEVCEPRISKRRLANAKDLAAALRALQKGKRRRRRGASILATAGLLSAFVTWVLWQSVDDQPWFPWKKNDVAVAEKTGLLRVVTTPEGAEVFSPEGALIGITPTATMRAQVGSEVRFLVRKKGYRTLELSATVTESSMEEPMLLFSELLNFSPPMTGEKWEDQRGVTFLPEGDSHVSADYVSKEDWEEFLASSKRSPDAVEYIKVTRDGETKEIVLAQPPDIIAFADWLRANGIRDGYLTNDNEVFGQVDSSFEEPAMSERARRENLRPFRVVVREYSYGSIQLTSDPPGADIYINGRFVGTTEDTLLIPKVRPGPTELLLILEGYKPLTVFAEVTAGRNLPLEAKLEKNEGVVFGSPWENSLGMDFVPVAPGLMVSVYETQISNYLAFTNDARYPEPVDAGFPQGADHPVVNISRQDAESFCEWLTEKEQESEHIAQTHRYRLPTDVEWSRLAGLDAEVGEGPSQRDANKPELYPWGPAWPPPQGFANYADATAAQSNGVTLGRVIADYEDGFARTAPAGSFSANSYGLFDTSGNVHEWVSNDIQTIGSSSLGVVRGSGWNTHLKENLLIGWRNPVPAAASSSYYGFRVVLAKIPFRTQPETMFQE